jgi:hypothetical protein
MGEVRVEERSPRNLPADQASGPLCAELGAYRGRLDIGVVVVE